MIEWTIQNRKIKDLKKHSNNPRRISKEQFNQIQISLDKFGLIEKPVINQDNTIISGHQRIQILKKNNHLVVDCWVPNKHLNDKEVDELLIRFNKNHASWDYDILANSFEIPDLIEYGFTTEELEITMPEDKPKKEKKKKECPHCGNEL